MVLCVELSIVVVDVDVMLLWSDVSNISSLILPFPPRIDHDDQHLMSVHLPNIHPYTYIMAASMVSTMPEDITASTYVGFDCEQARLPR
jgi:hypothetical protein